MSGQTWAEILAPLLGVLLTIVYRLVDRFIPDESGSHPLPATAADAYVNERALMSEHIFRPNIAPVDEDTQPVEDPTVAPDAEPVQDSGPLPTDDGDTGRQADTEPEEDADPDPDEGGGGHAMSGQ